MIKDLPLFNYASERIADADQQSCSTGPFALKYAQRLKRLYDELGRGLPLSSACDSANLTRQTVYAWMHQYPSFKQSISKYNDISPKAYHSNNPKKSYNGPSDPRCTSKICALFDALKDGSTLREASIRAGLSNSLVYKWKRQHPDFARQIDLLHSFDQFGQSKIPEIKALDDGIVDLGFCGKYHLYFIKAQGCDLIKIGVSTRPIKRVSSLQTGSPLILTLDSYVVGAGVYEKPIHDRLSSLGLHSHGEWFKLEAKSITLDYLYQQSRMSDGTG